MEERPQKWVLTIRGRMKRRQRPDGGGERWIAERKVEFRRLLRLARLLLLSVLAGDIA
jgi:hypothetical protein